MFSYLIILELNFGKEALNIIAGDLEALDVFVSASPQTNRRLSDILGYKVEKTTFLEFSKDQSYQKC